MKELLKVLINICMFGFMGVFIIALTQWMIYYLPEIPLPLEIMWVVGSVNILVYSLSKDWCPYIDLLMEQNKSTRRKNK